MIRVTIAKIPFKGKEQIVNKFINPCNMVAQMYFHPGSDPFDKHDFSQPIPNSMAKAKALVDVTYSQWTLATSGMDNRAKWNK